MFAGFYHYKECNYHYPSMSGGNIMMDKVNTHDNPTNVMTKSFFIAKFKHCLMMVGDRC